MTKHKPTQKEQSNTNKPPETPAEIDAFLRANGIDPVALGERMMARIQPSLDEAEKELEKSQK